MYLRTCILMLALVATFATETNASLLSGTGGSMSAPALSGATLVDFNSTATGLYPSLTFGNLTITGVGADFNVGPDYGGSYNNSGQSVFNDFDLVPTSFRFDFASAVSAFGFNWGASDNSWTMTAYDSSNVLIESYSIAPVFASNAGDYYGISASGISYVTLVDNFDRISYGDYVFIDDFAYKSSSSIPEPTTLMIWAGLGLGLVVGQRRLRG